MATPSIRIHRSCWEVLYPLADALCVFGSLWLVKWTLRGWMDGHSVTLGAVATLLFLLLGQLTGLYRSNHANSADREIVCVVTTWLMTVVGLALLGFLIRYNQHFARSLMLVWAVLAPTSVALLRMCARIAVRVCLRRGIGVRNVAIAGLNDLGLQVARNIESDPGLGLRVTGFFDDRQPNRLQSSGKALPELRGTLAEMVQLTKDGSIEVVLVTLPMRAENRIRFVLNALSDSTASVYIVPDFFVFELLHSRWTNVGGLPAVSIFENPLFGVDGFAKRIADVLLAGLGLLVCAVPMLCIAAAVKLTSHGPVFFRQRRYGLDGREILVWKFRSMRTCDDGPSVQQATKDDPRVTAVGRVLRKSSLDELPQLFNVLEGTMSLVGPRPHATAHNELYRKQIRGYMLRHKIKPGITGLAQVHGCRGETDTLEKMQRRVEYDHQYIRAWSLWLDLKILIKTLKVVWRQPEAY